MRYITLNIKGDTHSACSAMQKHGIDPIAVRLLPCALSSPITRGDPMTQAIVDGDKYGVLVGRWYGQVDRPPFPDGTPLHYRWHEEGEDLPSWAQPPVSPQQIANRIFDGVANYYRQRALDAHTAGYCAYRSRELQQADDYVFAYARMQREYGTARRVRMAELARTGLGNRDLDEAGLWWTPLDASHRDELRREEHAADPRLCDEDCGCADGNA